MPNASPADVRAGWEIFIRSADISLEELNRRLAKQGRGPVAERSRRHYRNLLRAGYDRYVSVNRFDVAKASRPYEGLSASSKYFYWDTNVPVDVDFVRRGEAYRARGHADRVGEVGAVITFTNKKTVAALSNTKPNVNSYVQITFLTPTPTKAMARVLDSEVDDATALIEVEFTRLRSISDLTSATPLATEGFILRVLGREPTDRAADLIGRRIFYALEAIEACRSIANEIGRAEASSPRVVDPPQIERLYLENPINFTIQTAPAVGSLLLLGWFLVRSGVKTGLAASKGFVSAEVDKATARKINAEAHALEIDNSVKDERAQIDRLIFQLARAELRGQVQLAAQPPNDDISVNRRAALSDQLIDSLEDLNRQDVEDVKVEGQPPSEAA